MKMLVQALVLLLGASAAFGSAKYCSRGDAAIVMREWHNTLSGGDSASVLLRVSNATYCAMFEKDPATRELFARVNAADMHSGDFQAHSLRVINALDNLINTLQDEPTLDAMLAHLAQQHVIRTGVRHAHFHVMRDIIQDSLGSLLNEYNVDAWHNCLFGIFRGIGTALPD